MPERTSAEARRRSRAAAALLAVEALALAVFAIWVVVEALGRSDAGRVIGEGVTLLVLAVLGAIMTRSLAGGNGFARTPALVWQVLVALTGFFVAQAGQPLLGGVVALAGVAGVVLTALVPHADL